MTAFALVPVLIGIAGVLQTGLTQRMSLQEMGLGTAVMTNNMLILLHFSAPWFISSALLRPESVPEMIRFSPAGYAFHWWHLAPALCGMAFIVLTPHSFGRLVAFVTYTTIVATQMIATLIWDRWLDEAPLNWQRLGGAALVLSGLFLISLAPSSHPSGAAP